jgi:hypothetical protein
MHALPCSDASSRGSQHASQSATMSPPAAAASQFSTARRSRQQDPQKAKASWLPAAEACGPAVQVC